MGGTAPCRSPQIAIMFPPNTRGSQQMEKTWVEAVLQKQPNLTQSEKGAKRKRGWILGREAGAPPPEFPLPPHNPREDVSPSQLAQLQEEATPCKRGARFQGWGGAGRHRGCRMKGSRELPPCQGTPRFEMGAARGSGRSGPGTVETSAFLPLLSSVVLKNKNRAPSQPTQFVYGVCPKDLA